MEFYILDQMEPSTQLIAIYLPFDVRLMSVKCHLARAMLKFGMPTLVPNSPPWVIIHVFTQDSTIPFTIPLTMLGLDDVIFT
jgi:hypothetical protein